MSKAEKFEFISCAGIFIMHFSRVSKISWKSSCPSCDGQLSLYSRLFPRSTRPYATNIHNGMIWGHLTASKLIMLTFLSHHSQALIWEVTTWSRPNEFTSFHSKRQVILAKTHPDITHKELYMLGWCCRAHKARYHRRYLAYSFAELVSRRGFQNMNHISTPYWLFGEESSRYFHDIILEQERGWRAAEKEMNGKRRWSSCPESERQEAISHVLRDVS